MIIKYTKQCFILLLGFCFFSPVGWATTQEVKSAKPDKEVSIDKIAAIVNDDVVTATELNRKVKMAKEQLSHSDTPLPSDKALRKTVLQQLIDQKVQLQLAHMTGIRVSSQEINTAIKRIAEQNKFSMNELYHTVERDGWTIKEFREQIRDDVLIQKLQERSVGANLSISDQEINDALRLVLSNSDAMPEYHVANILIALPATPSPQQVEAARKKAENVVAKLKKGENFQKLAASESSAEEALKGGDLGWRTLAELPEPFVKPVEKLRKGEVAGPIHAANGFHIIKLLGERNKASEKTVEEAKVQMIYLNRDKGETNKKLLRTMNKIRAKIGKSNSFENVAKQYSEDKETALQGGHAGWVNPNKFSPVVNSEIRSLKTGEISQPVLTKEGVYLIKVVAKRRAAKSTESERNQVQQMIYMRKLNEGARTMVNRLRSEGYIKILN